MASASEKFENSILYSEIQKHPEAVADLVLELLGSGENSDIMLKREGGVVKIDSNAYSAEIDKILQEADPKASYTPEEAIKDFYEAQDNISKKL